MYKNYSDLEVIEKWNSNIHTRTRADIEAYLYKKYQPLCVSMSRKYKSLSSIEDNMQECYLIMLKALEWIKTDKITNQNQYSFGSTFKSFLSSYFNCSAYESFAVLAKKESVSLDYPMDLFSINRSDNRGTIFALLTESFEEETICHSTVTKFKHTLKDAELYIWNKLEEGKKQKDIAKELGKSSINFHVQKLKAKYIQFMNNNGYAIQV